MLFFQIHHRLSSVDRKLAEGAFVEVSTILDHPATYLISSCGSLLISSPALGRLMQMSAELAPSLIIPFADLPY